VLDIDCAAAAQHIEAALRQQIGRQLHRRGAVVAVSGGVDSALCLTLAVRALGRQRVLGLLLPERESPPDDTARGRRLCEALGVECPVEDITAALEALGCYRRRDDAIRALFSEYGPGWRSKISVGDDLLERERVQYFTLTVESPSGVRERQRMPLPVYLGVVAATNMKQRTRKLMEYYYAERHNYAVVGTPNRLEYELGFFVRGGDGLADLKPIAHLYKTQVYALAHHLGVPEDTCRQPPSTGTYSLPQTQSEFFFGLPVAQLDLLLYAHLQDLTAATVTAALGLTTAQVERVFADITAKRRLAEQLRRPALLVETCA
jgi:NAD+ synthase